MTDIDKANSIINLNLIDDETTNYDNFNLKLRSICKSSSHDTDTLVNSLHECDETLNKTLLNEYYSVENYLLQPQLVDLNNNAANNTNTNNQSIVNANSSNRYINCSDWTEGINPWQLTHPYPYYINYLSLLNRKRNRRFDIEFDDSLGLFVPSVGTSDSVNNTNNNNTTTTTQRQNGTNTSAPGYMRDIHRAANNTNSGKVLPGTTIVYDKSFVNPTKRASSASQNVHPPNNQQQRQPNNSMEVFSTEQIVKQQQQQPTSIAQAHIYSTYQTNVPNSVTKQQQMLLYNTLTSNSLYSNKGNESDDLYQPLQQQQQQSKREKSSYSDLDNNNSNSTINRNFNFSSTSNTTNEKIDKIRKHFNAIVNKTQISKKEFLLNVEDFEVYEAHNTSGQLIRPESNQNNNKYRMPINQIEAQINSKTSNLTLEGESLNFNNNNNNSEKNSDYISITIPKRHSDVTDYTNRPRNAAKLQALNKFRHSNANSTANELSLFTSNPQQQQQTQIVDAPLLPPIISGKRINLPHGPHRQVYLRYMDGFKVVNCEINSSSNTTSATPMVKPSISNFKTNKKYN